MMSKFSTGEVGENYLHKVLGEDEIQGVEYG
jgi:hypothetical protein